jgi:hypothetical protein
MDVDEIQKSLDPQVWRFEFSPMRKRFYGLLCVFFACDGKFKNE